MKPNTGIVSFSDTYYCDHRTFIIIYYSLCQLVKREAWCLCDFNSVNSYEQEL